MRKRHGMGLETTQWEALTILGTRTPPQPPTKGRSRSGAPRARGRALAGVQSQPLALRGPRPIRPVIREVPLSERALSGLENQGLARTLGSVTSQPLAVRQGVFRGGIFRGGIGDDAATPPPPAVPMAEDSTVLDTVNQRADQIVKMLDDQDKNRKLALIIAGASALFAAVKLGIIAFPHIKARVTGGG